MWQQDARVWVPIKDIKDIRTSASLPALPTAPIEWDYNNYDSIFFVSSWLRNDPAWLGTRRPYQCAQRLYNLIKYKATKPYLLFNHLPPIKHLQAFSNKQRKFILALTIACHLEFSSASLKSLTTDPPVQATVKNLKPSFVQRNTNRMK